MPTPMTKDNTMPRLSERRDASGRLTAVPLEARFWSKIDRRGPDACWLWGGHVSSNGYGQVSVSKGKIRGAHRVAYELSVGPIPDGMQLDHLCRNRACVNPAHLEPVSPRENTARGLAGEHRKAESAAITHCPHGHDYNSENTYVSKSGKRSCKRCAIDRQRKRRAAVARG